MCGSPAHEPGEDPVPHMWVHMGYQLLPYLVSPPSELPGGRWRAGAPGTHGGKRHGLCPFVIEPCPKYQQLPDPGKREAPDQEKPGNCSLRVYWGD